MHGGQCNDIENGYTCTCFNGKEGHNCLEGKRNDFV